MIQDEQGDLMKGRICLITGASSGIGQASALGLAEMGATVVMVCRDQGRGESALARIKAESGNDAVELMVADLSSQQSIRQLADEFRVAHQHLHVLINNAGTYLSRRKLTVDGLEVTFAVNYLARFHLTNLLLGAIRESAPARIVDVAGAYHSRGKIDFDDLQAQTQYHGSKANNQAKLANVLFTYELARRLEGTGVTANCLHPGAVATSLLEKDPDYPRHLKLLQRWLRPFFKSARKGAETVIFLATSPEVEGLSGRYFTKKRQTRSSPQSYDAAVGGRLWEVSAQLANLPEDLPGAS